MKTAIMQPYYFPYIGYFQLMNVVDEFIVYDNIKYTKEGWINRNRVLLNGKDTYITLPVKKDSDHLNVRDRSLAPIWNDEKNRMLNRISAAYHRAPFYQDAFPLIEKCILFEENNLFRFIYNSLLQTKEYLEISTPLVVSSSIPIDHTLKAEEKVLEICKARRTDEYYNPVGGTSLYSKEKFKENGIKLYFLKTRDFSYKQFDSMFIPFLSIIDVMMFNSKNEMKIYINSMFTLQ